LITVIIAAAGSGSRMGRGINKVFLSLCGQPVLAYSLSLFSRIALINEIIIVTAEQDLPLVQKLVDATQTNKPTKVIAGGSERQYSIANALQAASNTAELILVHDGARPLVSEASVLAVIEAARQSQAAGIAVPVKDTIKIANEAGFASATPNRNMLWAIQTPQAFAAPLLRQAYDQARRENFLGTDDASLVERLGVPVKLVPGEYRNLKITTPEDLQIAEVLYLGKGDIGMRVGIGYDVHRLTEGRKLVLGGVEIEHDYGLDGHSDADVLLHSIKDALLGAAALGDIGRHFPDNDSRYKGISSLILLAKVRDILEENGFIVNNVDATIVAEKPKLASYIQTMNANIADTLRIASGQVNIKATTTEGLGFAGRREGIAAYSIVSIIKCKGE